jgi:hypothetical protein
MSKDKNRLNVIYEIQKIQNQLILLSAVEMSIHWCNKNINIKIYVKMAKTWYLFIKWGQKSRPYDSSIYVKSSALCTSIYGHIIKLNKQHNKTMIWLGIK